MQEMDIQVELRWSIVEGESKIGGVKIDYQKLIFGERLEVER